jgi:hypothetical protein
MAKDKETQSRQIAATLFDPFGTLRSEMNRLFDSFTGGLPHSQACLGPAEAEASLLRPIARPPDLGNFPVSSMPMPSGKAVFQLFNRSI